MVKMDALRRAFPSAAFFLCSPHSKKFQVFQKNSINGLFPCIGINRQKKSSEGQKMIQPQFENHRYVGEICRVKSQSIVECRLPGSEVNGILAIHAHAVPGDSACLNGEVQYGGRVLLCVVYEDGNKKICRAERGVEFFHKAEGEDLTPSCFAKVALSAENVAWRREGSGIYVSIVVDASIVAYGGKQMEYLVDGEDLVVKKAETSVFKSLCVSGDVEGEDEFDTDYVGDVLLHDERAIVTRVTVADGQIDVEGELHLHVCVLKEDESVCSYERLVPFKSSIPSEEAFGKITAGARVFVKSAQLTADTDEEKGKGRIVFSYCLAVECYLVVLEKVSKAEDAFSLSHDVTLKTKDDGGMYLTNQSKWVERVRGGAILSPMVEGDFTLQAAMLPRTEILVKKGERGMEVEGAVLAEVLFRNAEGNYRSATLSVPILFPVEVVGDHVEADAAVCGLNVRRKKDGEMEAECIVKLSLRSYEKREWSYVNEVAIGEAYGENEYGFSIFMTEKGEELWQVAKRIRSAPEEVVKSNPTLEFPLKGRERLFVYRRRK